MGDTNPKHARLDRMLRHEIAWLNAACQEDLNRIFGTEGVTYDVDLFRELGFDGFMAYIAIEQLHAEFGDDEIDMDRARREPSVYLRVLDRVTAKRESEAS